MSNFDQLKADFSFDNNNNKGSNTFEKSYGKFIPTPSITLSIPSKNSSIKIITNIISISQNTYNRETKETQEIQRLRIENQKLKKKLSEKEEKIKILENRIRLLTPDISSIKQNSNSKINFNSSMIFEFDEPKNSIKDDSNELSFKKAYSQNINMMKTFNLESRINKTQIREKIDMTNVKFDETIAKLNIYIRKNKGLQNFRNKYKLAEHISDREIKKALIDAGLHEEKAVGLILNKSNK